MTMIRNAVLINADCDIDLVTKMTNMYVLTFVYTCYNDK